MNREENPNVKGPIVVLGFGCLVWLAFFVGLFVYLIVRAQ